jgi:hypothetical protein
MILVVIALALGAPGIAGTGTTTSTTRTTLPGPRVTICHVSTDEGAPKAKTLRVARASVQAHLAHGDDLGACEH